VDSGRHVSATSRFCSAVARLRLPYGARFEVEERAVTRAEARAQLPHALVRELKLARREVLQRPVHARQPLAHADQVHSGMKLPLNMKDTPHFSYGCYYFMLWLRKRLTIDLVSPSNLLLIQLE
jgi:hypothetical protein